MGSKSNLQGKDEYARNKSITATLNKKGVKIQHGSKKGVQYFVDMYTSGMFTRGYKQLESSASLNQTKSHVLSQWHYVEIKHKEFTWMLLGLACKKCKHIIKLQHWEIPQKSLRYFQIYLCQSFFSCLTILMRFNNTTENTAYPWLKLTQKHTT